MCGIFCLLRGLLGVFFLELKTLFNVISFTNRKFGVIATVQNIEDGFVWHLVVICGTTYLEFKLSLLLSCMILWKILLTLF